MFLLPEAFKETRAILFSFILRMVMLVPSIHLQSAYTLYVYFSRASLHFIAYDIMRKNICSTQKKLRAMGERGFVTIYSGSSQTPRLFMERKYQARW
jgi:hypothetical protein